MRANPLHGRDQGETPAVWRLQIGPFYRGPAITFIFFGEFDGVFHAACHIRILPTIPTFPKFEITVKFTTSGYSQHALETPSRYGSITKSNCAMADEFCHGAHYLWE